MNYYVRSRGEDQIFGPYTVEELEAHIISGDLTSTHLALVDTGQAPAQLKHHWNFEWVPISKVPGLKKYTPQILSEPKFEVSGLHNAALSAKALDTSGEPAPVETPAISTPEPDKEWQSQITVREGACSLCHIDLQGGQYKEHQIYVMKVTSQKWTDAYAGKNYYRLQQIGEHCVCRKCRRKTLLFYFGNPPAVLLGAVAFFLLGMPIGRWLSKGAIDLFAIVWAGVACTAAWVAVREMFGRLPYLFRPAHVIERKILLIEKLYRAGDYGYVERTVGNQGETVGFTTWEYRNVLKHQ